MVPEIGLEPIRCCQRQILSQPRGFAYFTLSSANLHKQRLFTCSRCLIWAILVVEVQLVSIKLVSAFTKHNPHFWEIMFLSGKVYWHSKARLYARRVFFWKGCRHNSIHSQLRSATAHYLGKLPMLLCRASFTRNGSPLWGSMVALVHEGLLFVVLIHEHGHP